MIVILVCLLSGLMFSLGLWLGTEAGPNVHISGLPASNEGGREPASEEEVAEKKDLPGQFLRDKYLASKKEALENKMLAYEHLEEPRSAMDAAAHEGGAANWARRPAANDNIEVEKLDEARALALAEEERKKKGPPKTVESLFERSVDAVEDFSPVEGSFTVQVASFATQDEAHSMVRQLRKSGFLESYSKAIKFETGETWHRVAIGSYPNPIFARKIGSKVKKRGLTQDFIVRKVSN